VFENDCPGHDQFDLRSGGFESVASCMITDTRVPELNTLRVKEDSLPRDSCISDFTQNPHIKIGKLVNGKPSMF
jgi:hypothetical protein